MFQFLLVSSCIDLAEVMATPHHFLVLSLMGSRQFEVLAIMASSFPHASHLSDSSGLVKKNCFSVESVELSNPGLFHSPNICNAVVFQ